ncbi:MAG: hypothetical protein OEZ04_09795, partial [Nitrospinota bacterium]|nr:hypothetical protein [Nitrospinota bacterium]
MFRQNVFSNNGTLASALALLALIAGVGFSGVAAGAAPPPSGPAVAAGCAVGGSYASAASGGFSAADYTFANTTVTGGEVELAFSTPTVQDAFTVPFDQDVYAAFVYEDPLDTRSYTLDAGGNWVVTGAAWSNSLGWFVRPLVEQEMAAVGLPVTGQVYFGALAFVDGIYSSGNDHLFNYLFANTRDRNNDNVLEWLFNPIHYTLGAGSTGFTSLIVNPVTENDYSAKGMLVNGDGVLDGRDTRVKIGRFKAGTKISFFQHINSLHTFTAYTPKDTASDTYWSFVQWLTPSFKGPSNPSCSGVGAMVHPAQTKRDLLLSNVVLLGGPDWYQSINLKFNLDDPAPQSVPEDFVAGVPVLDDGADCKYVSTAFQGNGGTTYPYSWTQGLFPTEASAALKNIFGLSFTGVVDAGDYQREFINSTLKNWSFNRSLWLGPVKDPFSTLLAFESHYSGYDLDFNDNMYLIESRNGGTVTMNTAASPSASLAATGTAFITTATIKVQDTMPSASCGLSPGDTRIDYYMSTNNGQDWLRVHEWDLVKSGDNTGGMVYDWTPGITETSYRMVTKPVSEATYREATLSFINNAVIGDTLLWKADMITSDKECSPKITSVALSYNASEARGFAHTAPVPLSNVIYDASFKWSSTWQDNTDFRGHVFSKELYDPWFSENSAGFTPVLNWDAGDKLGGAASTVSTKKPDVRNILLPDTTVYKVTNEVVTLAPGSVVDGVNRTVSGRLANANTVSGTIEISGWDSYGRIETFRDYGVRSLDGEMVGTGDINRGTGDFTVTFTRALGVGTHLTASYHYYVVNSATPIRFNTGVVPVETVGLSDRTL